MFGLGRLKFFLRQSNLRRVHRTHRLENLKDYSDVDNVVERYRKVGGLVNDFQAYKLFSLVQLLKDLRPENILELGSGTTTAVFADWVRSNQDVRLHSLDESDEWIRKSSALAGISEDDERFRMMSAPKIVEQLEEGRHVASYDKSLTDKYDFVLIDGPSLNVDGRKRKDTVNTDIFKLVEVSAPQSIIVDIRVATVRAMIEKLHDYNYFISDLIGNPNPEGLVSDKAFGLKAGYRYFSYFQKK